jgi:hypothetical protein
MINGLMVFDAGYCEFAVTGFQAQIAMNDDSYACFSQPTSVAIQYCRVSTPLI